jgi:hypothetical protein
MCAGGVAAIGAATRCAMRSWTVLFVIGLLIGAVMAWRSQVGGDQLNLLARGWLLAARQVWILYGKPDVCGRLRAGRSDQRRRRRAADAVGRLPRAGAGDTWGCRRSAIC